ncbi:transposase-like protein [Sphingobium xenophagum]|uniref:Mutator family transposase n=1 Tax=Sphingobium xenophagum TaxID=121428 RepID=A0ABU1X521_SPHXE|nr:transposase-like protein [Sphingobium xenophagum]
MSPDLISTLTDPVLDEVAVWQQRPLDAIYPLVFFDAIRVKIRDEGMVRNKAIHIALGVRAGLSGFPCAAGRLIIRPPWL